MPNKIFGLREYWKLKGQYISLVYDPLAELDIPWIINYITEGTMFGTSPLWLDLSKPQKEALCRRLVLREILGEKAEGSEEIEEYKFNIVGNADQAELFIMLSGMCYVVKKTDDKIMDRGSVARIGSMLGAVPNFDTVLSDMLEAKAKLERLVSPNDDEEDLFKGALEEREGESLQKPQTKYIVTGKKTTFLRLHISDYHAALFGCMPADPYETMKNKMSFSDRKFYDIKTSLKQVAIDASFLRFLEKYGLIGRIVKGTNTGVEGENTDELFLDYFRTGDPGRALTLYNDSVECVYIFISGGVQVNLRSANNPKEKRKVSLIDAKDVEDRLSKGQAPDPGLAIATNKMPLMRLVPGSIVSMENALFQVQGTGLVDDDDQTIGTLGSLSPSRKTTTVKKKAPLKPLRQRPGALKKYTIAEKEDKGPFALEIYFEKHSDFFAIPISAIRQCLKEEPYDIVKSVYNQLYQAGTIFKERLSRLLPWVTAGLTVPGEGAVEGPTKKETPAQKVEKLRPLATASNSYFDSRFSNFEPELMGTFKRIVREDESRDSGEKDRRDRLVSQSLGPGVFMTAAKAEEKDRERAEAISTAPEPLRTQKSAEFDEVSESGGSYVGAMDTNAMYRPANHEVEMNDETPVGSRSSSRPTTAF